MPRAKKAVSEEKKIAGASQIAVVDATGKEIRRYSFEDHGEQFVELAEGFATKNGYKLEKVA